MSMSPLTTGRELLQEHPRLRATTAFVTTLCGGLAALIVFLALMGAFSPAQAVGASVVGLLLAAVYLAVAWTRVRRPDERRVDWSDRERRGF